MVYAAAEGLPLLPMIDVLRSLSEQDGGRLLEALAAGCPAFVRDEMARLLPEQSGTPEPAREVEPEAGRRRVFDAIRRMLSQWGARQRAAMIIEDAHWADSETCELVDYLIAPGRRTGVPIVLTCRSEQAAPEFATWLERWQRVEGVHRIDLAPLSEQDTTEQIAALLDRPVPHGFARDTYARSEGNPFFTEQLVAWAATASFRPDALATLPPGLTSLLLSRTRKIAGSTREILSALAVAKRPLTESDLVLLTGLSDAKTRQALYQLHALNLLRPTRGDGVELRHALLAEAVAADLLAAERRDQHGRVADLLIARNCPGDAADIGEHLAAAGRTADELRWRITAARDAERVFALAAASRHWQRLMALWDDVDDAESVAGLSFFEVYENTRETLSDSGDDVGAGALTEAVFGRLGSSLSGEPAVRMYCALGHYRGFRSGEEAWRPMRPQSK
jgi:predicted ATPase